MNAYLVNVIEGLTTFVLVWGGIAWVHHRTCDCGNCRPGRLNDSARFLPGVR